MKINYIINKMFHLPTLSNDEIYLSIFNYIHINNQKNINYLLNYKLIFIEI